MLRFPPLLLLLLLFFSEKTFSQPREVLKKAETMLEKHGSVSDSIVNKLIKMASDSSTEDSIKVEIVHFLGKVSCDSCLLYLVEHITDPFSYGDGISDIDQSNQKACFHALEILALDPVKKWILPKPIFTVLRRQEKSGYFVRRLFWILKYVSGKDAAKALVQHELKESSRIYPPNEVYRSNLLLMLKEIEMD